MYKRSDWCIRPAFAFRPASRRHSDHQTDEGSTTSTEDRRDRPSSSYQKIKRYRYLYDKNGIDQVNFPSTLSSHPAMQAPMQKATHPTADHRLCTEKYRKDRKDIKRYYYIHISYHHHQHHHQHQHQAAAGLPSGRLAYGSGRMKRDAGAEDAITIIVTTVRPDADVRCTYTSIHTPITKNIITSLADHRPSVISYIEEML